MKATFVKKVHGWRGDAELYRCDPGGSLPEHVVVSAANTILDGEQTLIFASDGDGVVDDYDDLPGSSQIKNEGCDISAALRRAGYDVVRLDA